MASQDGSERKVRFLIISDTHNALPADTKSDQPFRWPLPKADVLLHAGDLTMNGTLEQHQKALELIKGIDAELKIVIPGNHDLTLDREYYDQFWNLHGPRTKYSNDDLDQIEYLYAGVEAQKNGIVYLTEGVREFTLRNGATFRIYASAWQPEFWNWAFGYDRERDRFNSAASDVTWQPPNPVPDEGIDIMITHGPPQDILDKTFDGLPVGCKHLRRAVERCKPKLHVFGHIHEGWGGVRKTWSQGADGQIKISKSSPEEKVADMGVYLDATDLQAGMETLFVNAAIMDLRYRPAQAPWIVDLMLSAARTREAVSNG